jgi:predicted HTH transcriptional regulator
MITVSGVNRHRRVLEPLIPLLTPIHPGQEQDDYFAGYSMPCNKTLMRIFKDLDMVEYLGSGMPRILKAYSREVYTFSSRFIRATFPISQEALALEREVVGATTEKNHKKELQERTTGKRCGGEHSRSVPH